MFSVVHDIVQVFMRKVKLKSLALWTKLLNSVPGFKQKIKGNIH